MDEQAGSRSVQKLRWKIPPRHNLIRARVTGRKYVIATSSILDGASVSLELAVSHMQLKEEIFRYHRC